MNAPRFDTRSIAKWIGLFATCVAAILPASAKDAAGSVSYSPTSQNFEGNMPYSQTATVSITSPTNLVGSATINLVLVATEVPVGTAATALTYINLSSTQLTFSGPGQSLPVTVTCNFPNLGLPPSALPVSFSYRVETSGWPVTVSDFGYSINARATPPPPGQSGNPPTISISTPTNNQVFAYNFGEVINPVPLTFTAVGDAGGPILSIDATLISQLTGLGVPLVVTPSGLGTPTATGTATMPIVTPGAYSVRVTGYNQYGNASATHNFTVSITAPVPPEVVIGTPVDGSVISVPVGSLPLTVPMTFTATVPGLLNRAPITQVTAEIDGAPLTLSSVNGLNTFTVTGTANLSIATAGSHNVTVRATNAGGTASDVNMFRVNVTAAPPTVVITTPTPGSTFTYRTGAPALVVPFTFTGRSNFGGVRTLVAKVDGVVTSYTPAALGALSETRTINLSYNTAGTHTLEVTVTDDYGTASTTSNFSVSVLAPTPTIAISNPTQGQIFNLPSGATTMPIPFTFATTSNNGFVVDSVSASLDGGAAFTPSTTGLGTALATSTGTLANVGAGTHTLTATGTSAGINVTTSVTFTVRSVAVPPSVVINTPPVGSTYTRVSGGPALSIPMTFTGTSNTVGAVITRLTATLDGVPLTITTTNLNTPIANGAATMSVSNAGTHTISVSAVDAYGTASTTRTFVVTVVQGRTICGDTFFDVDGDGTEDCAEFGVGNLSVALKNAAGQTIATDTTDSCGGYSFSGVAPGTYTVVLTSTNGYRTTTVSQRTVTVSGSDVCVSKFGIGINFTALRTMTANGFTIGYWKNNLDKAIANRTNGIQVSRSTLLTYTDRITDFGLTPYDCATLKTSSDTMGYSGSNSASLLSKQLIASEYNYQSGAYIGGDRTLTFLFLYWGEYVLSNSSRYSSSYLIWAKDWFDAYNNSHGGLVLGPQ